MSDSTRMRFWEMLDRAYAEHAPMPSVRELMRGSGLSTTSTVQYHLEILERAQVITRDPGKARSIRLEKPYPR